jgi:hypothetical protein
MPLQLIINRTAELRAQSGRSTSASVRSAIMARASRLVTLADMQARHTAENGLFRATRSWLAKAAKMRTFVERQRLLLERLLAGGAEGGGGEGGGVEGGGAPSQSPSQDAAAADKAFGEPSTAAAEPLRRAAQDLEEEVSQIQNVVAAGGAGGVQACGASRRSRWYSILDAPHRSSLFQHPFLCTHHLRGHGCAMVGARFLQQHGPR